MSNCKKKVDEVKELLYSHTGADIQEIRDFYDSWCESYEEGFGMLDFMAPKLGADSVDENFSGNREDAQVLDVACGTGWVAKLLTKAGFKNITGVDGSKGMLELAAKTGLYKDLKQVLLGTQPLPVQSDAFDVVVQVGALGPGFIPASVLKELCHAAKPGGLVCLVKGEHRGEENDRFNRELRSELQRLEDEGLWSQLRIKFVDRYMKDTHPDNRGDQQREQFIPGTVYLYKKSI
ncbi:methyltransferase-like protein 27 [Cheilinus undulatus]|uniref:methyltransferase-like protein 27 n=1 Tax=Cheilinus undulatus TaxID=241271 RepID=UPI001BD1C4FE|nr:methyltransferase-like protein 27 [Cheilinus undulatus]